MKQYKFLQMRSALKPVVTFLCIVSIGMMSYGQDKKKLVKSWIKQDIYSLPDNKKTDDTVYTRYTFQKNNVYISFYPGWNDHEQEWSLTDNLLTLGLATYVVEELTDSTLIISIPSFRRIVLKDENYLARDTGNLHLIGEFNHEPLYKANKYITPRYKKIDFRKSVQQNLEQYHIKKAITFAVSFVVKKDGNPDSIHIINSINSAFDAEVVRQIKKSSGNWAPAVYKGQPVQTQMIYTIKYLDSITDPNLQRL